MKNLFLRIAAVILFIAIFMNSCQKDEISKNETWKDYFIDSVGLKHNVIVKEALNKIEKNKDVITLEDIYYISCDIVFELYEIDSSEIPSYSEILVYFPVLTDTTMSLSEKYQYFKPDCSLKEINYVIDIENKIKETFNSSSLENEPTQIESSIIVDTDLTNESKGDLLIISDVATNSYELWEKYYAESKAPWWWVVACDAGGALVGSGFGPGGALVIGAVSSLTAALTDIPEVK
ncbi:MAG: hypothetical protein JXL97_08185 [Bacteroidales bacterium]|nr:hypothetical protein [Bacteroidales bacterium]